MKCKCGRVVTIGELEKHESQCQAQDWQQKVKELTSENEALRKENRTLKEELAALKAPLSKPAVAEVSRKRGEPPAKPKSAAEERKAHLDLHPSLSDRRAPKQPLDRPKQPAERQQPTQLFASTISAV